MGLALLLACFALGLLWGGWKWSEAVDQQRSITQIEEEMENGFHALAARIWRLWFENLAVTKHFTCSVPVSWRRIGPKRQL